MRYPIVGVGGLLLVLGASPPGKTSSSQQVSETQTLAYPLKAGGELVIENINGAIELSGWDEERVEVVVKKRVRAASEEEARAFLKRLTIAAEATPDRVVLRTEDPSRPAGKRKIKVNFWDWFLHRPPSADVSYLARAPRRLSLSLTTTNGAIRAREVEGTLEVETMNGGVELHQAAGRVTARTTNGEVTVSLEEARGPLIFESTNGGIEIAIQRGSDLGLSATTTNGSIALRLPQDVRATLRASTTNGVVRSAFPVSQPEERERTSLWGEINGGGPSVELSTTNGNISIDLY